jgi:hypothetical protein
MLTTTSKVGSRARQTDKSDNNVEKRFVKLNFLKPVSKPNSSRPKNVSYLSRKMRSFLAGSEFHGKSAFLVFITSNFMHAKRYIFSKYVVPCTQNTTLPSSVM